MNVFRWLQHKTKKALIGVYGPPTLHEDHDPIVQADREFAEEVRAEEQADAEEQRAAEHVEGGTDTPPAQRD